jgi:hypothetical protein
VTAAWVPMRWSSRVRPVWLRGVEVACHLAIAAAAMPCRAAPAAGADPVVGLFSVPAEACSLAAASGFNVIQSYSFQNDAPPDTTAFVIRARAYLDAAARCHLGVLLGVPGNWIDKEHETHVRAVMRALRGHPALRAWYEEEFAERGRWDVVTLFDQCVREEDPAHGLVIEDWPQDPRLLGIGHTRMFTYYPVTDKARSARLLKTLPEHFHLEGLRVPFWPALQAFGRDFITGPTTTDLRIPTPDELRFSLISALAAGARGVFFYPYLFPTRYIESKAAPGHFSYGVYRPLPDVSPPFWSTVVASGVLARQLLSLLQGAGVAPDLHIDGLPEKVQVKTWRTKSGFIVLMANPAYDACDITLRAPNGRWRGAILGTGTDAQVLAGNAMQAHLPGPGGLALSLEPAP